MPRPLIPLTLLTLFFMGFLKNVFRKKPGGTFFGNLIRGATGLIPGVGPVINAINQPPGQIQPTVRQLPSGVLSGGNLPQVNVTAPRFAGPMDDGKVNFLGKRVEKWIPWAALVAGLGAGWYFFIREDNGKGRRRRR